MKTLAHILAIAGAIACFAAAACLGVAGIGVLLAVVFSLIPLTMLAVLVALLSAAGFRLLDINDPLSVAIEKAVTDIINKPAKES